MPKHPDDYKIGAVDLKVEKVVEDEKKAKESDVFGKIRHVKKDEDKKKKKKPKPKPKQPKPRPRPRPRSY